VLVTARPRGGPPVSVVTGVNGTALASLSVVAPSGPLAVGTRARVHALARGADGTTVDVTPLVEWTSSDPSVASVSSVVRPGWLATLNDGTTTLQARLLGAGGNAEVQVSTGTPLSLSLAAPATLQVGTGATPWPPPPCPAARCSGWTISSGHRMTVRVERRRLSRSPERPRWARTRPGATRR
jgi:hypothetical protein